MSESRIPIELREEMEERLMALEARAREEIESDRAREVEMAASSALERAVSEVVEDAVRIERPRRTHPQRRGLRDPTAPEHC